MRERKKGKEIDIKLPGELHHLLLQLERDSDDNTQNGSWGK
jgi:hypothetical protein